MVKLFDIVVGAIVIAIAALLLVDAYLTTYNPAGQVLSPNDVKGVVGMALVVLAASYFQRSRE